MELLRQGKVRDVYADGDDLVLVASDRVSVYDVVLPTAIPDKGAILTQLSLWWFRQLADVAQHHLVRDGAVGGAAGGGELPVSWQGRAMRCRRLDMVAVEWIVRGFLAGSGWASYERTGSVSGVALPPGLRQGSRLDQPVLTPSTKAAQGDHDELVTMTDVQASLGEEDARRLGEASRRVYARAAEIAWDAGLVLVDTKLEFGRATDGQLLLADEVGTPDSSRFWRVADWQSGGRREPYDKQVVRDWSATVTGWDRTAPGPEIPDDVVRETRRRYVWVYEALTGQRWSS